MSINFIVPNRSWADIEAVASKVRRGFRLEEEAKFPAIDLLERIMDHKLSWVSLRIGTHSSMDGAEGFTDPLGKFIELRSDVYEGAWASEPRSRFTVAHELGHWFMHTNVPLARAPLDTKIASYRLSEPQANRFAAELLMPWRFFSEGDTECEVAERHGVSIQAARNRLSCRYRRNEANGPAWPSRSVSVLGLKRG